jgi:predicted phage-related endonuclease
MSGASPDGLVGDRGLVEIKCPQPTAHIETLDSQAIPAKYIPQMDWQLACTGRDWCDFVSYNPEFPEKMRMFVKRLERDDKRIKELEAMVEVFLDEVQAKVLALKSKFYPIELAA